MGVNSVKMGIYRHYKGELYQVIGLGHDANMGDRIVVVYMPLQLNAAHFGPRMAVRAIEDFEATVHVRLTRDNWDVCPGIDKCMLVQRMPSSNKVDLDRWEMTHKPRFNYLGAILTPSMMEPVIS